MYQYTLSGWMPELLKQHETGKRIAGKLLLERYIP